MPKVAGKKFPYTTAGKKAARRHAKKTGGKKVVTVRKSKR